MKRKTKMGMGGLFTLLLAFAFNCFAGTLGAQAVGATPLAGMAVANIGFGIVVPMAARTYSYYNGLSAGTGGPVLYAGVIKELWLPLIMEKFFVPGDFVDGARDLTSFASYGVVHAADAGVYPTVLVNNNSFPLTPAQRTDSSLDIPMNTLNTVPTFITNVEEMQTAYDKMASVTLGHQRALQLAAYDQAIYNWAPSSNGTYTPVFKTAAPFTAGASPFTAKDMLVMQQAFNQMKAPGDRTAVLHPQHLQELLAQNALLFQSWTNLKDGQALRFAGWDIYSYPDMPVYNGTTGVKTTYQAAPAGTDSPAASVFFCRSEVFKAMNAFDMFYQPKSPLYSGDLLAFEMRFLALPVRNKAIGAIYSATS